MYAPVPRATVRSRTATGSAGLYVLRVGTIIFSAAIASLFAVRIASQLLGRVAPARPSTSLVGRSRQQLLKEYRWIGLCAGLVTYLTIVLFTLIGWWLLSTGSQWARPLASAEWQIYAGSPLWGLPAFPLGLYVAAPVTRALFARWLGHRLPELVAYEDIIYGFDSEKVERWLMPALPPIAILLMFFVWNFHASFAADRVEIRQLFGLSTHVYPYSDVVDVKTSRYRTALSGRRIYGREYLIVFRDGEIWGTHFGAGSLSLSAQEKREIAVYVASKSGLSIREVAAFTKAESS